MTNLHLFNAPEEKELHFASDKKTTILQLFHRVKKNRTNQEIADALFVHKGTVDRWERLNEVPAFYKNDLLRILNAHHGFDIGVQESDQYYTLPATAKRCLHYFTMELTKYNIDVARYVYVEPSAGCGHFYSLLPRTRRMGIEIDPQKSPITNRLQEGLIKFDFLKWEAPKNHRYLVIGNPPFGRNGKTALDFVIKSFTFADFVGFILPPIFDSTGKGSCKNRLTQLGYILLRTENLDDTSFVYPNGNAVSVKTIFQVWAKKQPEGYKRPIHATCASYVDIYNICIPYKPSRSPSNIDLIGKCDIYLPRTFWKKEVAKATNDFYTIPYKDGYGIVIKKKTRAIRNFIKRHDWASVVHTSTNNSRSLRKDIIRQELIKAGFIDQIRHGLR